MACSFAAHKAFSPSPWLLFLRCNQMGQLVHTIFLFLTFANMRPSRNIITDNAWMAIVMVFTSINELLNHYWAILFVQILLMQFQVQMVMSCGWWSIRKSRTPRAPYVNKPAQAITSEPSTQHNWYDRQPFIVSIWLRTVIYGVSIPLFWYGVLTLPLYDANGHFYLEPLVTIILDVSTRSTTAPDKVSALACFEFCEHDLTTYTYKSEI